MLTNILNVPYLLFLERFCTHKQPLSQNVAVSKQTNVQRHECVEFSEIPMCSVSDRRFGLITESVFGMIVTVLMYSRNRGAVMKDSVTSQPLTQRFSTFFH